MMTSYDYEDRVMMWMMTAMMIFAMDDDNFYGQGTRT